MGERDLGQRVDREVVGFRPGKLVRELLARGEPAERSWVARRDLERYYAVLRYSLEEIDLTEAEALLVLEALQGSALDAISYRLLWKEVEDALSLHQLDRKWQVDGAALVARLRALSPGAAMAVADAAERASRAEGDLRAAVRAVGLVRRQRGCCWWS